MPGPGLKRDGVQRPLRTAAAGRRGARPGLAAPHAATGAMGLQLRLSARTGGFANRPLAVDAAAAAPSPFRGPLGFDMVGQAVVEARRVVPRRLEERLHRALAPMEQARKASLEPCIEPELEQGQLRVQLPARRKAQPVSERAPDQRARDRRLRRSGQSRQRRLPFGPNRSFRFMKGRGNLASPMQNALAA